MGAVGFIVSFVLFITAAGAFPVLNTHGASAKALEFIYFFSSFWIQFGPGSTTFLPAAEVYPAPVRATAHGFSAAIGMLGVLAATVLYNYIGSRTKFWVVSWFRLIGFILTVIFPDTTGLDLREQEQYWPYVKDGRPQEYHGIAIHPRHLSWFERVALKRHLYYNPDLDRGSKGNELRQLWEKVKGGKSVETDGERTLAEDSRGLLDDNVSKYFERETASILRGRQQVF